MHIGAHWAAGSALGCWERARLVAVYYTFEMDERVCGNSNSCFDSKSFIRRRSFGPEKQAGQLSAITGSRYVSANAASSFSLVRMRGLIMLIPVSLAA